MSRRITFAPGEYYHLYNRGTEKRNVFPTKADHHRFLSLLYLCNSSVAVDMYFQGRTLDKALAFKRGKPLVEIGGYCLMPNHFHLLVRGREDGGVSRFMQKLTTGYTMYFNKRHDRSGALFQGKFKATHASDDRYLAYLIAYIHLNPIKLIDSKWKENGIADLKRAKKYLSAYEYSSYLDYLGKKRLQRPIINLNALPKYFQTPKKFYSAVTEWLDYQKRGEIATNTSLNNLFILRSYPLVSQQLLHSCGIG